VTIKAIFNEKIKMAKIIFNILLVLSFFVEYVSVQEYLMKCSVFYIHVDVCMEYKYNTDKCFPWKTDECEIEKIDWYTQCRHVICKVRIILVYVILLLREAQS
jgi:hypothetical protein